MSSVPHLSFFEHFFYTFKNGKRVRRMLGTRNDTKVYPNLQRLLTYINVGMKNKVQ